MTTCVTVKNCSYISTSEQLCLFFFYLNLFIFIFFPFLSFYVPVNSKTAHPPPPGQTPGHLTFLKNFGQIPRYVASLDGQMPHPLELQRGSNPPPSRHVTHGINEYKQNRLPLETNSAKFSATTNFLFATMNFLFAPHFKQRDIPRYNYINRQQQKNPRRNRQEQ